MPLLFAFYLTNKIDKRILLGNVNANDIRIIIINK